MANSYELNRLQADASERFKELSGAHAEIAEHFVEQELTQRVDKGFVLQLSEDEERLLKAYRSFVARSPGGEAFKWHPPKPEGIVVPAEPSLLVDPREVNIDL